MKIPNETLDKDAKKTDVSIYEMIIYLKLIK